MTYERDKILEEGHTMNGFTEKIILVTDRKLHHMHYCDLTLVTFASDL